MPDPRAFAIGVATKAAKNIGGSVADVLKRTKSQAYLFGQMRRAFPEHTEEQLREVLARLKHDAPADDFATEPRRPTKGREAAADPCWPARAAQLASLIECSPPSEVLDIAQVHLGWARNFTIQTLAAAEDAGLLTYDALCWARSDAVTKAKIKTIRIERTLPCPLTPAETHQSLQRAMGKLAERERLETELKQHIKAQRALIVEAQKEFYRLLAQSNLGVADRPVICEQATDYKLGTVEVTRLDTKELVEARVLRPDEKQLELGATA